MRILALVGAVLLGAVLIAIGALGARWFAPGAGPTPQARVVEVPATTKNKEAPAALDLASMRALLAVLDEKQRGQILDTQELFAQFVKQETLNQAVLAAARANGADRNPAIRTLMDRAGQRVLAEAYLNQVVRMNLDPKFPTDEQVREAYDRNPEAFRVPERMHLWQIFLPLPAGADDTTFKSVWALAERLSAELRAGKGDFAALAKQYSGHEASRVNDGYMGLIKTADLLPPIAAAATKLKAGAVSEPIASEAGLHIVRRGTTVAAELLEFDKVKANVRERLQREAAQKVREAAIEKIAAEYPVAAPQADLESWRADLKGDGEPPAAKPAS